MIFSISSFAEFWNSIRQCKASEHGGKVLYRKKEYSSKKKDLEMPYLSLLDKLHGVFGENHLRILGKPCSRVSESQKNRYVQGRFHHHWWVLKFLLRGYLTLPGGKFGSQYLLVCWGAAGYWHLVVEARDIAKHPVIHIQPRIIWAKHRRIIWAKNVNSVKVEKSCMSFRS